VGTIEEERVHGLGSSSFVLAKYSLVERYFEFTIPLNFRNFSLSTLIARN